MLVKTLLGVAFAAATAIPAATPTSQAAPPITPWAESLAVARERAKSGGRPLLVNLYTSWCGWCKRMDRETYRDARVLAKAREEFVFVSLNAEDGKEGSLLARDHRISSYPAQILLDEAGREIGRLNGFRAPDRFLADLERIQDERKKLALLLAKEVETPGDPQIQFDLASMLARAQRRAEAATRFDTLLARDDESSRRFREAALWSSATLELELGRNERAIPRFEAFIAEFPDRPKVELALYQLGRIHQAEKRRAEALAAYRKLIERFPTSRYATGARLQVQLLEAQR